MESIDEGQVQIPQIRLRILGFLAMVLATSQGRGVPNLGALLRCQPESLQAAHLCQVAIARP